MRPHPSNIYIVLLHSLLLIMRQVQLTKPRIGYTQGHQAILYNTRYQSEQSQERKNATCSLLFPGKSQTASDHPFFIFDGVKEFESPKSPERRFHISPNVIFKSRFLLLENLTFLFHFGRFCCRICEKATLRATCKEISLCGTATPSQSVKKPRGWRGFLVYKRRRWEKLSLIHI